MAPLNMNLTDKRKIYKLFALFILSFILVSLSLSIPHIVRYPDQKAVIGYPLPFYNVGESPYTNLHTMYPYQEDMGNPREYAGADIIMGRFLLDVIIVFAILFLIWMIKFKKYPKLLIYKKGAKTYIILAVKFIIFFIVSIGMTLLTVFIPKFVFSPHDFFGGELGFPAPILMLKIPSKTGPFPYRLQYSYILNSIISGNNILSGFDTFHFKATVILMFIIVLLFWYAYSRY